MRPSAKRASDSLMKKKILLLNPPFNNQTIIKDQYCSFTAKASYNWLPIDLQLLSGILDHQFELMVIDGIASKKNDDETLNTILLFNPEFIITLSSAITYRNDLALIQKIKKRINIHAMFIGDIFYFYPETMIHCPEVDSIMLDLANTTLPNFIEGLELFNNIVYKHDSRIKWAKTNISEYREYPPPAYKYFNLENYSVPFQIEDHCSSVFTSFGCPYACKYCSASNVSFTRITTESFEREIQYLKKINIRNVWIRDFTFAAIKEDALKAMHILQKNNFKWFCTTRADVLDLEIIETMGSSGCYLATIGIDTTSVKNASDLSRAFNCTKTKETIANLSRNNIETLLHIILGLPQDTVLDMIKTILFCRNTTASFLSINFFSPRCGTKFVDARSVTTKESICFDSKYAKDQKEHRSMLLFALKIFSILLFYSDIKRIVRILRFGLKQKIFSKIMKTGLSSLG